MDTVKEVLGEEKYISALIANKSDLYEEQKISNEEGREFSNKHKIKFKLTSACSDPEGFKIFLKDLIIDYINLIGPEEKKYLHIKITQSKSKERKKKFIC